MNQNTIKKWILYVYNRLDVKEMFFSSQRGFKLWKISGQNVVRIRTIFVMDKKYLKLTESIKRVGLPTEFTEVKLMEW